MPHLEFKTVHQGTMPGEQEIKDLIADREMFRTLEPLEQDSEGRKNRARVRSRTFPGFARALASQWGAHLEGRYA